MRSMHSAAQRSVFERGLSRCARGVMLASLASILANCSLDGILSSDQLPPAVVDPALTNTPVGAVAAYYGTLAQFARAFGGGSGQSSFVGVTGVLTDELQPSEVVGGSLGTGFSPEDSRILPETIQSTTNSVVSAYYGVLHRVRGQASQAIGLLTRFAADSAALVGHLYAIEGYAEVFLAELFCSGIPLSTLDFDGDYTLKAGSSTEEVYHHAVSLFDSALALSADSIGLTHLARVGRARALLGIGDFAGAAASAAQVPDGFRHAVSFTTTAGANARSFAYVVGGDVDWPFSVSNGEGIRGLDYRTSADPRTTATALDETNRWGQTLYHPTKYATDGSSPIVLADWVEARLIQAEAALLAGDVTGWLALLNRLRQTAISPALADLEDPGTSDGRVDLLFRERAFWLFLTGHRQGDLRRLVRQYDRSQGSVYPNGPYPGGGTYGSDVTTPVPGSERLHNPLFTGCLSRGA